MNDEQTVDVNANGTGAGASDPLGAVADAMQAAADAVGRVGQFTNRLLYTTSYAIAYGAVFPLALVALSVPQNNPFVHGLIDGSRAARNKVDGILTGTPATEEAAA
ncbi:MAG: hypothetical protein EBX35_03955 [Planctomycetia bacterium]|nr:hypothetical protein [Planctomycetia bacterium]